MHGRQWLRGLWTVLVALTLVVVIPPVTGGGTASASASQCAAVGPALNHAHPELYKPEVYTQIDPDGSKGYSRSDTADDRVTSPTYHTDLYACQHGALIAYVQTFWPEGIVLKPAEAVQKWSLEVWVCGQHLQPSFNVRPVAFAKGGWVAYYAPIDYTWHGHNGKFCGQQAIDIGSEFNFPGAANQPAQRGDPKKGLPDQLLTHV